MIRAETIPDLLPAAIPARRAAMPKSTATLPTFERSGFDYTGMDSDVARLAQAAASRIRDRRQAAIVEIGRELNAIKDALPHGQFGPWLQAEFGWSQSTALNFMRVAGTIGDKFATVANLPPAVIYKLAAPSTPPEVRERILDMGPDKAAHPSDILQLIEQTKSRQRTAERRRMESNPTPEEQAKAQRFERRQARDHAQRDAEDKAAKLATRAAAAMVREALGTKFPAFQDLIRGLPGWYVAAALLDAADPAQQDRAA